MNKREKKNKPSSVTKSSSKSKKSFPEEATTSVSKDTEVVHEEEDQDYQLSHFPDSDDDDDDDDDDDEDEDQEDEDEGALHASENESDEERTPTGRLKKPRGKRQIYFECAAIIPVTQDDSEKKLKVGDNELILERIPVTTPSEGIFNIEVGRKEAIQKFEEKYKVTPKIDPTPLYEYKGLTTQPKKRESVRQDVLKKARFTGERREAIHVVNGIPWRVIVNLMDDPRIGWALYDRPALKIEGKKIIKPQPKTLQMAVLQNVQDLKEADA